MKKDGRDGPSGRKGARKASKYVECSGNWGLR